MLQKTKILNFIEDNFTNESRIFTYTEFVTSACVILGYIKTKEEYTNDYRGVYCDALYTKAVDYFYNGSKREPRYITKIARGRWQISGPLQSELKGAEKSPTPMIDNVLATVKTITDDYESRSYLLIKEYPGSPEINTIYNKETYPDINPKNFPEFWKEKIIIKVEEVVIVKNISKLFNYFYGCIDWDYDSLTFEEKEILSEEEFSMIKLYFRNINWPLIINQDAL